MGDKQEIDAGLRTMIADYMEKGFLDNIIDMFAHDSSLYPLIGELIRDERMRVRIGVTALMEELSSRDKGNVAKAVPMLLPLLTDQDPVVRGDACNLLGIIGSRDALNVLTQTLADDNPSVQLLAREAIEDIQKNQTD